MSNKNKITQPSVFGPGKWHDIHTIAKDAITDDKKKNFLYFMGYVRDNLPCLECRGHCGNYMKTNPLEPFFNVYDDKGNDIGLFKWSWQFHNAVNQRLKKPIMTWNEAMDLYYNEDGVCTSSCDEEHKSENSIKKENSKDNMTAKQQVTLLPTTKRTEYNKGNEYVNLHRNLLTNSSIHQNNKKMTKNSIFRNA